MKNLNTKAKELLTLIPSGKATPEEIDLLLNEIKSKMKSSPELGRELGPLIPAIKNAVNSRVVPPPMDWVSVGKGFLAIGHKPGGKLSFAGLKAAGTTAVLTLLMEREGAREIGTGVEKAGMNWLWFPFSAVNPEENSVVEALFQRMKQELDKEGRIYLHCSAGIHRTGMITYAFLRHLGLSPEEAMNKLTSLRKITAEGATEKRIAWGDLFAKD